jgi:hypothetical protein
MPSAEDRLARLMLVVVPITLVALGCGVSLLPHDVIMQVFYVLAAWLTLSLPIGIVVGHCALDGSD